MACGLLLAICFFVMALLNGNLTARFGSVTLVGISAAVLNLLVTPLMYGFFAVLFSLFSYYPLTFLLRKMKGLTLEGEFEVNEASV